VPELAAHVDVGLSQISRALQAMSGEDKDKAGPSPADALSKPGGADPSASNSNNRPYSVVFVARSGQSSAFHCHFPQMVATSALSQPADQTVRLVGFSKACEDRLSAALGIPRVSSVGLREDAPQAKGLVDFVRQHVAPVDVSWLREAQSAKFLATKIDAVATKVGSKKLRLS
jgi:ribonuclease P/MRP protein subunit POP3